MAWQVVLVLLTSCGGQRTALTQDEVSAIADSVWTFSQSRPDGFTLDIRTFTEPKTGIAVSYAATQGSHSRELLDSVVRHALSHDDYVGGWYNYADSLYYFDSTRLFPEDSLGSALRFGKENGQLGVFILSSAMLIPIDSVAVKPDSSLTTPCRDGLR